MKESMMKLSTFILQVGIVLLTFSTVLAQKQTPPPGSSAKPFSLPEKKSILLDNGLEIVMVQFGEIPKTHARLVVRTGNIDDPADKVWIADLVGDFLREGTQSKTGTEISSKIAQMGGQLSINTGLEQVSISTDVLSEFTSELISIFSEIAMSPSFPESELERLKNAMLRNLSVQKSQAQSTATEKFAQVMYGDHPFGRYFPSDETIRSFSMNDVKSFFDANYGAQRSTLYIVGKFDPVSVEKSARQAFSSWKKGNPHSELIPTVESKKSLHFIDRPGAVQSTIMMGLQVANPASPDYVEFLVVNSLLGGSFGSRITRNIREHKGYTYSPSATVAARYRNAYWAEFADVTDIHTGASLKEIFFEINKLSNEAPSHEELKGIQNYMSGIFVLQNSAPAGIANVLSFTKLHGLGDNYLTTYVSRVNAMTPEKVKELTAKYIRENEMIIVVVGDAKKVIPQLKPYGPILRN